MKILKRNTEKRVLLSSKKIKIGSRSLIFFFSRIYLYFETAQNIIFCTFRVILSAKTESPVSHVLRF